MRNASVHEAARQGHFSIFGPECGGGGIQKEPLTKNVPPGVHVTVPEKDPPSDVLSHSTLTLSWQLTCAPPPVGTAVHAPPSRKLNDE